MDVMYLNNKNEFYQFRNKIKFIMCPHCGKSGFLICHGSLRGYSESGQEFIIRGQRFFVLIAFVKVGVAVLFLLF